MGERTVAWVYVTKDPKTYKKNKTDGSAAIIYKNNNPINS